MRQADHAAGLPILVTRKAWLTYPSCGKRMFAIVLAQ